MFAHRRLERKIDALHVKLDLILDHLGIQERPDRTTAKPIPAMPVAPRPASFSWAEIDDLLVQGKKIQAIKRYRELTGAGLKDAKDAVEQHERRY
ncbi:ribosomal protein bL12 [Nocardia brasiliensis]|uniref:ribosomal protein bL12 n=1 Tax=Nocardia brasiliensis TaxID=37326 RepID=UPI002454118A|nr:50S ribosomal protein L7/L12 [Nocardia brasiliensis]